jgi:hypothetical protein
MGEKRTFESSQVLAGPLSGRRSEAYAPEEVSKFSRHFDVTRTKLGGYVCEMVARFTFVISDYGLCLESAGAQPTIQCTRH